MTTKRSVNIYDYPEHLNPFFEDDNHTKLRFSTNTKKKSRSNSFNFQSFKDFKQSLFSRPKIRKRSGTSSSLSRLSCYHTHEINDETPQNDEFSRTDEKRNSFLYPTLRKLGRSFSIRSKNKKRDTSLDRTTQNPENEVAYSYTKSTLSNRQTMPVQNTSNRELITPLPRIRFHERLRNVEVEKNDEIKTSSPMVDDTNPFKDEVDDVVLPSTPSTSKPSTPPRKKKRAPPPPPLRQSSLTRKSLSTEFPLHDQEHEDNTTKENKCKDIEATEVEITKIETETTKIETETTKNENTISSSHKDTSPEYKSSENNSSLDVSIEETEQPFQINYNSELNISSSEISVTSETKLEQQQQQNAMDDSSDLLELVQKLQLEVEKLTDDTNNNVIATNFDSGKRANFYGYDDNCAESISPSKMKTEVKINLDVHADADDDNDDDDDVVIEVPMSPRLVRLRKDHEWIKH